MTSMKAVRIHSYGGPEVLIYEDAPKPEAAADEVLIKIHAAGVNPVDGKIREGYLKDRLHHRLLLILGWDVSGTVEAVGSGVTSFFNYNATTASRGRPARRLCVRPARCRSAHQDRQVD